MEYHLKGLKGGRIKCPKWTCRIFPPAVLTDDLCENLVVSQVGQQKKHGNKRIINCKLWSIFLGIILLISLLHTPDLKNANVDPQDLGCISKVPGARQRNWLTTKLSHKNLEN